MYSMYIPTFPLVGLITKKNYEYGVPRLWKRVPFGTKVKGCLFDFFK